MKLGLALAGGGVKGAAHIGVIKALEENGIQVDAVAGTSIGSIVAALYSMGYTTEKMLEIFKYFAKEIMKTDTKHFVGNLKESKRLLGYGLISGENTEMALKECARQMNIKNMKDIKMPISIPTVDIVESKKYVFTNADFKEDYYINDALIEKAVRASSSYPGVFAPCEYLGHKFVDGGILDNVPAGEVRKLGANKVLTIKFSAGLNYEPKNIYEIAFKSVDILFEGRSQEAIHESDMVLDLDLSEASVFNIKKIDYCYNVGYITALTRMKEIKQMLEE